MTPRQLCDAIESYYGTGTANLKQLEACLAGRTPQEICDVWPQLRLSSIPPTCAEINKAIRETHQRRQQTVQDERVSETIGRIRAMLDRKDALRERIEL